jgi:uncharacterized protein (TIGR03382 family)
MRRHAIIVFTLLCARAAWPCGPPDANLDGPSAPRDARERVPQNMRFVLDIDDGFDVPVVTGVALTSADGTSMTPPFSTEGTLLVVQPPLLAAETTYTIEIRADQRGEEPVTTRTFTTTTGEDTTAPVMTGDLAAPTYSYLPAPLIEFSSCGPLVNTWIVDVNYPEVSDDMGLGGAHIYTVDENGGRVLRMTDLEGLSSAPPIRFRDPGTYTFQVDVFDLAGNTTSSNEVTVILQAPIVSCSAAHVTTTEGPSGAIALLVMAFANVRRRGRRRA